ncbi:MAG TPA: hypothetical protein VK841_07570 [Polyangiaceae bacterium]|nr:hypothetical protein [Polyangiaceae bacterium]
MMKRFLSSVLFASAVTAIAVACDSSPTASFSSGRALPSCSEFGVCETCALQPGCGWCYFSDGTGSCSTGPEQCQSASEGTWTWYTNGCRTAAQPTVGPEAEGGTSAAPSDAAAIDGTPATDSALGDSASPANDGASVGDGASPTHDAAAPMGDSGFLNEGTPDSGASTIDAGAGDAEPSGTNADAADGS